MLGKKKQSGFSYVEFLVGNAISIFTVACGIFLLGAYSNSSKNLLAQERLEHELTTAMNIIASDIRRAGYFANAADDLGTNQNTNPFMTNLTDLQSPSSSCILFSYDTDSSGTLPSLNTSPTDKRFGYRLNNNILQTRSASDTNFSCTTGSWEDLTTSSLIKVTNLSFSINKSTINNGTSGSMEIRAVTINISAQLVDNSSISDTLSETIKVRNDKYIPYVTT